jgi:DNA-binding NtrC family response regulator
VNSTSQPATLPPPRNDVRNEDARVIELRAPRLDEATLGFVGASKAIRTLREQLRRAAHSERPVLIRGPTGSGKELAVRALHALGRNPSAPLVDVNCGGFTANLIESQLFGHERGAFTGAARRQEGFFSAVGSGTLFLDEIAELPLELQAKLLRALESGVFRPIGSTASERFAGRAVAATHADLEARVAAGTFREDLLYRLDVLTVRVPGLEERREDIPALVVHFVHLAKLPLTFTADAFAHLAGAHWPGNVRQLRNLVDRLGVFAPDGPITPRVIDEVGGLRSGPAQPSQLRELARAILDSPDVDKLALLESVMIDEAMQMANGNKTAAARLLGVHRKVIERRV